MEGEIIIFLRETLLESYFLTINFHYEGKIEN